VSAAASGLGRGRRAMFDLSGGCAAVIAGMAVIAASASVQAESVEEYARMDCSQFVVLPLETQVGVLFWIDGYKSRNDGDRVLDFLETAYAIRDFEDACAREPRVTLREFLGIRF
jgi:hypothetical protein